jgi:hypothetical protein
MMVRGGEPPQPKWTYRELGTLPQVLDIVWCRFPYDFDNLQSGQKARPVLVRQRLIDIETRRGALQVAYGTRNLKPEYRVLDLILMESRTLDDLGLKEATRFDLDHTVTPPWCQEFFGAPQGLPLVIGSLSNSAVAMTQLARLKHLREQLDSIRRNAERGPADDDEAPP